MISPVFVQDIIVSATSPVTLIAGPHGITSPEKAPKQAAEIAQACRKANRRFIFKATFSPDIDTQKELETLYRIAEDIGCPTAIDVKDIDHMTMAAQVVDVLQVPAHMLKDEAFMRAAAHTGRVIHIKADKETSSDDIAQLITIAKAEGNEQLLFSGTTSDTYPTLWDATHHTGPLTGTLIQKAVHTGQHGLEITIHETGDALTWDTLSTFLQALDKHDPKHDS